jgi:hypothetical protein
MHALLEAEPEVPVAPPAATFPVVRTLRVELRATVAQRLAPLMTASLHGAFGHALRASACQCKRPPHGPECLYAMLAEAAPGEDAPAGVTTRAPSPVLFAPEDTFTGNTILLAEGERLFLRVTLIGPALEHERLIIKTMEGAAARGLGVGEEAGRGLRPSLSLIDASMAPAPLHVPSRRVRVRFVSPARIVDEGKIHGTIDARRFLVGLHRRADLLTQLYGTGRLPALDAPDVTASEVDTTVFHVRRFSTRQGRRMVWPGMMGSFVLEGDSVPSLTRLLAFGSAVQVGKGTTFGFGRFTVESLG